MRYKPLWAALPIIFIFATLTAAQPVIVIDAQEHEYNYDGQFEFIINLANEGESPLEWNITLESVSQPRQYPEFQSLVNEFPGINGKNEYCSPIGWDWDNSRMWVANRERNLLVAYKHNVSYTEFEEDLSIETDSPMEGCWVDGYLWITSSQDSSIRRYDSQGNLFDLVNLPIFAVGLAADVERHLIFIQNLLDDAIYVYQLSQQGNITGEPIGRIDNYRRFMGNVESYNLEWVPKHRDGELWVVNRANSSVYQLDVNTDSWTCSAEIQDFQVFGAHGQPYDAVAHDGNHLWAGGYADSTIRIYDDGVDELIPEDYLNYAPADGLLPAGADQDIHCTVNMDDLVEGDYVSTLHFLSNDQNEPDSEVSITLHVFGNGLMLVTWPLKEAMPEAIDFNFVYAEVFCTVDYAIPVTIGNEGTGDLTVNNIAFDNAAFRIEPTSFIVAPHTRQKLTLLFNAEDNPGVFEGVMTIVEAEDVQTDIFIHAEALLPPAISISPREIVVDYLTNDPLPSIHLENQGEGHMRWWTYAEVLADDQWRSPFHVTPGMGELDGQQDVTLDLTVDWDSVVVDPEADINRLHFRSNDPERPDIYVEITIRNLGVKPEPTPEKFELLAAYPNPFNSSTTISYNLRSPGQYALTVTDVAGREVARVSEGWRAAGSYKEVWDAKALPGGSYQLRLTSPEGDQTRQLILVK